MNWKKSHRYVALAATLPLLVIALTGVILQLRNQFEWIQPITISNKLEKNNPLLTLEKAMAGLNPEEVDQVVFRPAKGSLSVRLKDGVEIQMHPQTGVVLKKSLRRTNLLIELHQGSWLGPAGQYLIHFMAGLCLCFLIFSGIKIYPFKSRRL